jgi:hypothetical protein
LLVRQAIRDGEKSAGRRDEAIAKAAADGMVFSGLRGALAEHTMTTGAGGT